MKINNRQSAGCYVIRDNNGTKELLMMYREWPNGAKGWILPKGGLDEGETYEECALRETSEETGYTDIKILEKLGIETFTHPEKQIQVDIHWFLAKLISDKQQAPEYSKSESNSYIEVHWKPLEEAYDLLRFDEDKKRVKEIIDMNNLK